jgi:hypothetical protein
MDSFEDCMGSQMNRRHFFGMTAAALIVAHFVEKWILV